MSIESRRKARQKEQGADLTETGTENTSSPFASSTLVVPEQDIITVRLYQVLGSMAELADPSNPMVRVMKRTGRDMLTGMAQKIAAGLMDEDLIRQKMGGIRDAMQWALEAPDRIQVTAADDLSELEAEFSE